MGPSGSLLFGFCYYGATRPITKMLRFLLGGFISGSLVFGSVIFLTANPLFAEDREGMTEKEKDFFKTALHQILIPIKKDALGMSPEQALKVIAERAQSAVSIEGYDGKERGPEGELTFHQKLAWYLLYLQSQVKFLRLNQVGDCFVSKTDLLKKVVRGEASFERDDYERMLEYASEIILALAEQIAKRKLDLDRVEKREKLQGVRDWLVRGYEVLTYEDVWESFVSLGGSLYLLDWAVKSFNWSHFNWDIFSPNSPGWIALTLGGVCTSGVEVIKSILAARTELNLEWWREAVMTYEPLLRDLMVIPLATKHLGFSCDSILAGEEKSIGEGVISPQGPPLTLDKRS